MLGDESLPVIYNGIELEGIPFNDQPEDFFIAVGRMTPGKGIAEAIRIAQKACVRLLIVGQVTSHLPWSAKYFLNEIQPQIDGDRIKHIECLPPYRCLNRGGQIVLRDVLMNQGRRNANWGALFSVALLLHTPNGRCYALDEVRDWLHQAGFSRICGPFRSSSLSFDPDSILIAEKR